MATGGDPSLPIVKAKKNPGPSVEGPGSFFGAVPSDQKRTPAAMP
ncbi:hypothetical protein SAMN06295937_1007106 [Sphingopyxis flava]|uniref:Uncharacterized protein n=1 Tax=Sphingopyxis flava TaxID=1507287 RepID=A0A1T5BSR2_9SPHN|nr:hypothetical protein SAMN06295937_1007106 [Sphingopyxis flava]